MTAKTKTDRLKRLISHGYFAPELPPCFVSDDLAKYRTSILNAIDTLPLDRGQPAHQRYISEPAWFYFPRFGKEDRRHGVPNPISHLLLSRAIAYNYVDLRRRALASNLTLSPPAFDWSGPRALNRSSVDLRDQFRVDLSSRREEYVAADVRAFFHSIYTHSIPWAIYTKRWAKQNRSLNHYGNLIDLLCRNAQDGQTIGLPVGPDTSRLLAEIVSSAIDVRLQNNLGIGKRDASRYIDDYTLSSGAGLRGEALLAALRQAVGEFELELNNEKSGIFPTSHRQSLGWQQAVRAHIPTQQVPAQPASDIQVQNFFYQLGQLCLSHPEINVEKFGLQSARSVIIRAANWSEIQPNLISAYRRNPSLAPLLVEACLLRKVGANDVNLVDLREFLENRIPVLASTNRTGELIWLLFLAIRLNILISQQSLTPLFQMENAFVALLICYMDDNYLVDGVVDRSIWNRSLNTDGLRSPMWLYSYEATVQGLIPGVNDDFITQDPYFSLLKAKQVRFLDIDRGYSSMIATLRARRDANERFRRLREAIRGSAENDIDDFDDDFDYEVAETEGYEDDY